MKRWMVIGLKRYEGTDAMTFAPVTSKQASTVAICIEIAPGKYGPIVFEGNEDRHGYVDPKMGEERYQKLLAEAQAIVEWHNSQLEG